jgi:hypothetical protein
MSCCARPCVRRPPGSKGYGSQIIPSVERRAGSIVRLSGRPCAPTMLVGLQPGDQQERAGVGTIVAITQMVQKATETRAQATITLLVPAAAANRLLTSPQFTTFQNALT